METKLVTTPKSFFVKERDQFYVDWQLSFWREFFQNSTDAGAKKIDIMVEEVPIRGSFDEKGQADKERTRVVFTDDGCGMNAHTLDNVYFAIGQSTKDDESTVGGYGRARLMTCFSQGRYSILTRNNFVLGDGPSYVNYTLEEAEEHLSGAIARLMDEAQHDRDAKVSMDGLLEDLERVRTARESGGFKGCRVEIDIDFERDRWRAPTKDAMLDKLHTYLSESQLPCAVFINGLKPEERWAVNGKLQARRGPVKKELRAPINDRMLPFATVHTSEGEKARHKGSVIVRVDGASMFTQSLNANVQVIVEIRKPLSRSVLTSNRDGLKEPYRSSLEKFIAELNIDNITAMEELQGKSEFTIPGERGMIAASADLFRQISVEPLTPDEASAAFQAAVNRGFNPTSVDQLKVHGLTEDLVDDFMKQFADGKSFMNSVMEDYSFPLRDEMYALRRAVSEHYRYGAENGVEVFLKASTPRLREWIANTLKSRFDKAQEEVRVQAEQQLANMHDVHVSIISTNEKTKAAIRRNDPRKWDVTSGKGRTPRALLTAWTAACAVAVETLFKLRPGMPNFEWTTGWVYSVPETTYQGDRCRQVSVEALCKREGGTVKFLLNPVRDDGSLRYSVSDAKDRQRLQALAMHEVAHALENAHNETYANVLTDMMKEFDLADATRRMKDAVRGVMAAYENGKATVQAMDNEAGPRPAERLMAYATGNTPAADNVERNPDGTWSYDPDNSSPSFDTSDTPSFQP